MKSPFCLSVCHLLITFESIVSFYDILQRGHTTGGGLLLRQFLNPVDLPSTIKKMEDKTYEVNSKLYHSTWDLHILYADIS
jgi:hypothetical protein